MYGGFKKTMQLFLLQ